MKELLDLFTVKIAGAALTALLCWRLWRFTIRPAFYPQEPKELPYWIPFVGHAYSFFVDFDGTIEKGRRHFHPSRELFAMVVAGETMYVATSPEDINAVWKNTKTMDRNPLIRDMYAFGGLPDKATAMVSDLHASAQYNAENESPLAPFQMSIKLHHQQLCKGPRLDALIKDRILPGMSRQLDFSRPDHSAVLSRGDKSSIISLHELCVHTFVAGTTDAYWGSALRKIAPGLVPAFVEWEHTNWKFVFQLPSFLASDMEASKATVVNGFADYYRLPPSKRQDALWWVTEAEKMMREINLTEEEMAIFTLLHYWGIVGNKHKFVFWLLAHIAHDAALMAAIRAEVTPAVNGDTVDEALLEHCPRLDSLSSEVLRLVVASSLARATTGTCVVGGKTLRPGRKVMLPISQLHSDVQVWGSRPDVLQPDRFSTDPRLAKNLAYRPWGGGQGLCPGRFLVGRSVKAFVALLLSRYDLETESSTFPQRDGTRPSPGVGAVVRGQDVRLRCTPRV